MIMKRILILLSVLLLCACAPALGEEMPLTVAEAHTWLDALLAEVTAMPDAVTGEDETGAYIQADGVRLYLDGDRAYAAVLLPSSDHELDALVDMRGLIVTSSQSAVLAAYPNDNAFMSGDYNSAVLYIYDDALGLVYRDGQRLSLITHSVWQDDLLLYVEYGLSGGFVSHIYVELSSDSADSSALRSEAEALLECEEYQSYPVSDTGDDMEPFGEQDVTVSGMDFLTALPEDYAELLGAPESDTRLEDTTGETLRITQWSGVVLITRYTAEGTFIAPSSLEITADTIEGPRAARIGDSMETVRGRFRFSTGARGESIEQLYGSGLEAPAGVADYERRTLRYEVHARGMNISLRMGFGDEGMTELLLTATPD